MPLGDKLIRLAMTVAVITLASVSFLVSYQHCFALALHLGESRGTARLVPLTIDLLLIASAMTGLFCSRYDVPQPRLARVALVMGIGATLAANVAHGLLSSVWAALFGAWPAVALVISTELLWWVIATGRSLENRKVVVMEKPKTKREHTLSAVAELVANERGISAAEVSRRLAIPYQVSCVLTRQAKELLASA